MTPNWSNRTIWTGDNLAIMRGMNSESVDLIYLDPPFNSKRTYSAPIGSKAAGAAFKDTWTLDDVDLAWHGEIAEQNPAVYAAIDAAGITHGKGMKSYLIMMAVRLLEMHRILKPTGSLYLHCDPTASHYLKMLLDAIFGRANFRNEISWRRTTTKSDYRQGATNYPRVRDIILHASRNAASAFFRQPFVPYSPEYVKRFYRHIEEGTGRHYQLDNLAAPGRGTRGHPQYEFLGVRRYWRYNEAKMQRLFDEGRIVQTAPGRVPRYKRYLDEMPGVAVGDSWEDISLVLGQSKEHVGYPTQKPLALLDRIIKASSNEGDVVLDPFAGCATACVSAETLGRQWVGIDLSELAAKLVKTRLKEAFKLFYEVHHRDDVPKRTDLGKLPSYRTHRHQLFGKQEGRCGGCRVVFPFRNFTIDHVVPQSQGGSDHFDNLQLLCAACNSVKGDRDHAYLVATLSKRGIL